MRKHIALIAFLFSTPLEAWALVNPGAQGICSGLKGEFAVKKGRYAADCLTPSLVIQVKSADGWRESVFGTLQSAKEFRRGAKLMLVIEDVGDLAQLEEAKAFVRSRNLPLAVEPHFALVKGPRSVN